MGNRTINQLPDAGVLDNADIFPVVQNFVDGKVTLDEISQFVQRDSDYAVVIETRTADYDYTAANLEQDHRIFVDPSSGIITLGFFNGSDRDGAIVIINCIGSANQTNIELISAGVTDYILIPGNTLIIIWNDNDSKWEILYKEYLNIITANFGLISNKKYFIDGTVNLTLPTITKEGDIIEIFCKSALTKVLQSDSEEVIAYLNKHFTIQGSSGYLLLQKNTNIKLCYEGNSTIPIEPGIKLSDPATLPAGFGRGCAFSYSGIYLAVAHHTSPNITIYKRSGDTFTKLSNPATLPTGNGTGCAFSYDDVYLAVTHLVSPYITIYKRSGDTFTKLSNPATLPTGDGRGCAFSYDGVYLAVAHHTSPYITIYKRSGDTFTKLSNPATLPTGNGLSCDFSYNGNYLAIVHNISPFITIYKHSGDTFTKIDNPTTLPSTPQFCAFSYNGDYLTIAQSGGSEIIIYEKQSGDRFRDMVDPDIIPTGNGLSCDFSYNGNYLAIGHEISPYITIYKIIDKSFTKLSNPSSLPPSSIYGCCFSYDSKYLALACINSPYVLIYKLYDDVDKRWNVRELSVLNNADIQNMFK